MHQTPSPSSVKPLYAMASDTDLTAEREKMPEISRADVERLMQEGVVSSHPRIVHGAYVFVGTRVPLYNLWDYLAAGDSIEDFMESFPTVPRALVEKAIEVMGRSATAGTSHS